MTYPPRLQAGDSVAIVAPARKITPAQLEPALKTLESWGLRTILPKNIFSTNHSYLAGTDRERSEDFQTMLDDPKVKAIFSARGGYGSTRIIEDIIFFIAQTAYSEHQRSARGSHRPLLPNMTRRDSAHVPPILFRTTH